MAKNLTEEELKKVQELNQQFLQTKIEIADAFVALVKKVPNLDGIQTQFGELEKELISGRTVIHNYGHGGSGVTLSWGCAEEIVEIINE